MTKKKKKKKKHFANLHYLYNIKLNKNMYIFTSRKHAYIILTPLTPTFI